MVYGININGIISLLPTVFCVRIILVLGEWGVVWTRFSIMSSSVYKSSSHPFVQTVRVLRTVCQPQCECVAAGVTQCGVFPALQTGLSQQDRPDLTHGLTPLLLPAELNSNPWAYDVMTHKEPPETVKRHICTHTKVRAYFLVLWVNLSVSLSRARAYSASMSPRRRRNSDRSESCCCFTSTWESKIFIWSVSWARRSEM